MIKNKKGVQFTLWFHSYYTTKYLNKLNIFLTNKIKYFVHRNSQQKLMMIIIHHWNYQRIVYCQSGPLGPQREAENLPFVMSPLSTLHPHGLLDVAVAYFIDLTCQKADVVKRGSVWAIGYFGLRGTGKL